MINALIYANCPNLQCANEIVQDLEDRIYELLMQYCGGGGGVLDCTQKALDIVNALIYANCPNLQCGNEILQSVEDRLYDLLMQYCGGGGGVLDCSQAVLDIVNNAENVLRNELCGYEDWTTCTTRIVGEYTTLVGGIIENLCTSSTMTTRGTNDCIIMAQGLINNAVDNVCGAPSATVCVDMVLALVDNAENALRNELCGYEDWTTCTSRIADEYRAVVEGVVENACRFSTSRTVNDCVLLLLALVNQAVSTVCGTPNMLDCVDAVVADVQALLVSACQPIPAGATTSRAVVGHPCEDRVMEIVTFTMMTACESADPAQCATNLIAKIQALLVSACQPIPTGATTSSAVVGHPCEDRVMELVTTVLTSICGSSEPGICAATLLRSITDTIGTVCSAAGGQLATEPEMLTAQNSATAASDPLPSETDACQQALTSVIGEAAAVACGDLPPEACLLQRMRQIVDIVCPGGPTNCLADEVDRVLTIFAEACPEARCLHLIPPDGLSALGFGCPLGPGPFEANELPSLIPAECDLIGKVIEDNQALATVGPPGTTVESEAMVEIVSGIGAQELRITNLPNGIVLIAGAGSEITPAQATAPAPSEAPPAEPEGDSPPSEAGGTGPCSRWASDRNDWVESHVHRWHLNLASRSTTLPADLVTDAIRDGIRNITHETNSCGRADNVTAESNFEGTTSRDASFDNEGNCQAENRTDDVNVVDFGYLPLRPDGGEYYSIYGRTCSWTVFYGNELHESDVRLSVTEKWTFDDRANEYNSQCNSYPADTEPIHMEALMTHERGHTYGLAHVEDPADRDLTMYRFIYRCDPSDRTLGKGDMVGLEAKYASNPYRGWDPE